MLLERNNFYIINLVGKKMEIEEKQRENQPKNENSEKDEHIVEATLFVAGRFMSLQELVAVTGINPITLRETLSALQNKYSEGALTLVSNSENYKLDVNPAYHWLINKLASGKSEFTKAEQETLAIIAYKQPITQSVMVKIRGNKAYEHVKKFMDVGLIKTKRVGHTLQLSLNENFYDYFHLDKKEEKLENQKEEKKEE